MANKLIMAKSPGEALNAKTDDAVFVAGGTEVNRLGSDAAKDTVTLISLKKCSGMTDIVNNGGCVTIGAMCTFQQIKESGEVPAYLAEAAGFMASRTKRNMATIGGNIASKRSDSYMLPALYAAGAALELMYRDKETEWISVRDYLNGGYDDALIVSVTIPADLRMVSKRFSNTAQSHAVLTMSAAMTEEGISLAGAVKNVGILHFCDLEKAFRDDPEISENKVIEMVRLCTGLNTADDMFGSDAYKRYLIAVTAFDLHRQLTGKEV